MFFYAFYYFLALYIGTYSLQNVFSCQPGYDGIAIQKATYSDSNCQNLTEITFEVDTQNEESMPYYGINQWTNTGYWECRRIHQCSSSSIVTPTFAPTAAPTSPTQIPTQYPSLSPTLPTTAPTYTPGTQSEISYSEDDDTNKGNTISINGVALIICVCLNCKYL